MLGIKTGFGAGAFRSQKYLGRLGPCCTSQLPFIMRQHKIVSTKHLPDLVNSGKLHSYYIGMKLYSNFLLLPLSHWIALLALLIRLTVFEIIHAVTLKQVVWLWVSTKIAKPNLEEYVIPGLYISNMHLHMEQLNESLRKT